MAYFEPPIPEDDDFIWLASDLPNPTKYAEALLMIRRELARELLAAHKTATGWKYKYDNDHTLIRALRELGLCSMAGDVTRRRHTYEHGWHLSSFAVIVRARMIRMLDAGELIENFNNEEAAE